MATTIPTKPEEITKQWLQQILGDTTTVDDFKVSPATEKGENFTVQVVRCQISASKAAYTTSLIMKIMPFLEWQRELVQKLRFFVREVAAYDVIFEDMKRYQIQDNKLELSVPRSFFTTLDDARGIIVLEDLAPHGYKLRNFTLGPDLEHCKLSLREIAKFHALGFNIKYKSGQSLLELYPENVSVADGPAKHLFISAFENAIRNARDYFSSVTGKEKAVELLSTQESQLIEKYFKARAIEEPFSTLCHGDFWNNNMLFQYDEDEKPISVKLLDFQNVTYDCPTYDLAYFFSFSTFPELRRAHLMELLRYYYDQLFDFLEILQVKEITREIFSFDDLLGRYFKKNGIRGLLMGFHIIPTLYVPKENAVDNKDDTVESSESFVDKVGKMGKEAAKNNVVVQDMLTYLMEEMMEHGGV